MRYIFPARIKRDETGRWVVGFPDVPEALTDGADKEEALREAADALAAALAGYARERRPVPEPSIRKPGQTLVRVPLLIAAKLALCKAMMEEKVSNSELARRLDVSEAIVRRLVNPDHGSRIEKVEAALEALGRRLVLEAA